MDNSTNHRDTVLYATLFLLPQTPKNIYQRKSATNITSFLRCYAAYYNVTRKPRTEELDKIVQQRVPQLELLVCYAAYCGRCFGTTYRSHLKGEPVSDIPHVTAQEWRPFLNGGRSLKSRTARTVSHQWISYDVNFVTDFKKWGSQARVPDTRQSISESDGDSGDRPAICLHMPTRLHKHRQHRSSNRRDQAATGTAD